MNSLDGDLERVQKEIDELKLDIKTSTNPHLDIEYVKLYTALVNERVAIREERIELLRRIPLIKEHVEIKKDEEMEKIVLDKKKLDEESNVKVVVETSESGKYLAKFSRPAVSIL